MSPPEVMTAAELAELLRVDRDAAAPPSLPAPFLETTMPKHTPPADPSTLPYLLCAEEVAALLRVSRRAVYCMVNRGELPGVAKIGRRVRFRRDTILDWIEAQRVTGD